MKNFRSCFIVDVQISESKIQLQDNARNRFYIDCNDKVALDQFKRWFKEVFSKGIAQTLTVFEYSVESISECETEMHIKNFISKDSV